MHNLSNGDGNIVFDLKLTEEDTITLNKHFDDYRYLERSILFGLSKVLNIEEGPMRNFQNNLIENFEKITVNSIDKEFDDLSVKEEMEKLSVKDLLPLKEYPIDFSDIISFNIPEDLESEDIFNLFKEKHSCFKYVDNETIYSGLVKELNGIYGCALEANYLVNQPMILNTITSQKRKEIEKNHSKEIQLTNCEYQNNFFITDSAIYLLNLEQGIEIPKDICSNLPLDDIDHICIIKNRAGFKIKITLLTSFIETMNEFFAVNDLARKGGISQNEILTLKKQMFEKYYNIID